MRGMYSEDLSENRSPENRSMDRAGDIKMQKAWKRKIKTNQK